MTACAENAAPSAPQRPTARLPGPALLGERPRRRVKERLRKRIIEQPVLAPALQRPHPRHPQSRLLHPLQRSRRAHFPPPALPRAAGSAADDRPPATGFAVRVRRQGGEGHVSPQPARPSPAPAGTSAAACCPPPARRRSVPPPR